MDDFDAADVANGIHELYEPLAEEDGMTLHVKTVPAPLHGNRELISQALANLVENAIKYGKPVAAVQPLGADAASGSREILIEARRDGDQVLLSVTDRGPGIPEADRKHAVERFVRLEASRTQPGSGLGLSLASAVATLHGGDLTLGDAHPGLPRDAGDPGAGSRSERACGANAGCATEGGMNSSAKGDADRGMSGRALRGRTAAVRLPIKPNSVWRTGWPISSRSKRPRSAPAHGAFPLARTILLGYRGGLSLSFRSCARRRRRACSAAGMRAGIGIWRD